MTRLPRPELTRDADGILRSGSFDDIYYSPEDGLAESRFVFVEGNDLPRRLREAAGPFVVGELGFGTGLNVLALLKECEESGAGPVHVWSCEGFPLSRETFAETQGRVAERWPELAPYAELLAERYPDPRPGQVRIELPMGSSLTLAFGPVEEMLRGAAFRADAWFLDGFAPSKNPDMWSPAVMAEIARLTKPGGTAATFSVAGAIRDALAGAGFAWEKAPGFGRKRHMLRARLEQRAPGAEPQPWFASPEPARDGVVAIVGGGIAGACLAHALSEQEREVVLFDPEPGSGASGNPAGLVMPRLDADDGPAARFYRDAFLYAEGFYRSLGGVFEPCGGRMAIDAAKAAGIEAHGLWPEGCLRFEDGWAEIARAGVLKPREAVEQLLEGVEIIREAVPEEGPPGDFAAIVDARGAAYRARHREEVRPSLGQIDVFGGPQAERIVTDGHYVAPLGAQLVAGATYAPHNGGPVEPSAANSEANREAAQALLGGEVGAHLSARAALRATTQDRHPIAGPLYDGEAAMKAFAGLAKGRRADYPPAPYAKGRYALTGLGSRGLVTAPYLAQHVAAQICGGVSPLSRDIAALVHPGRFLIRDIRRGKVSP